MKWNIAYLQTNNHTVDFAFFVGALINFSQGPTCPALVAGVEVCSRVSCRGAERTVPWQSCHRVHSCWTCFGFFLLLLSAGFPVDVSVCGRVCMRSWVYTWSCRPSYHILLLPRNSSFWLSLMETVFLQAAADPYVSHTVTFCWLHYFSTFW